jgi:D-glycero-D-manno-heptose 1,7-bisphosphate phosphatase
MISNIAETRLVLQAGGRGQRMGDATRSTPKPLLPVGGTPMVERLLRQAIGAGLRSVTVITGTMGDRIEDHVRGMEGLPSDLSLTFIRETAPRGNVGSLAELPRDGRRALLSFADLVTDLDFAKLLAVHEERDADITLASHPEAHRLALGS